MNQNKQNVECQLHVLGNARTWSTWGSYCYCYCSNNAQRSGLPTASPVTIPRWKFIVWLFSPLTKFGMSWACFANFIRKESSWIFHLSSLAKISKILHQSCFAKFPLTQWTQPLLFTAKATTPKCNSWRTMEFETQKGLCFGTDVFSFTVSPKKGDFLLKMVGGKDHITEWTFDFAAATTNRN